MRALIAVLCLIGWAGLAAAQSHWTADEVRPVDPKIEVFSSGDFPSFNVPVDAAEEYDQKRSGAMTAPMVTTCSALAVVLGLFAALVWLSRKYGGKTIAGTLPSDLIQVLGTTAIDPKTKITLLRIGERIVVAARTDQGIQPLTEITGADEVQQLTARCTGDARATFSAAMEEFRNQPAAGFTEPVTPGRLFATA